jgi:hypothetical protein
MAQTPHEDDGTDPNARLPEVGEAPVADPRRGDHPTGEKQAADNRENEPPG